MNFQVLIQNVTTVRLCMLRYLQDVGEGVLAKKLPYRCLKFWQPLPLSADSQDPLSDICLCVIKNVDPLTRIRKIGQTSLTTS